MEDFQTTLETCHLTDLGSSRPKFTWSNRRDEPFFIYERLDRATANSEWHELFPRKHVEILASRISDHTPLLILLHAYSTQPCHKKKLFKYTAGWGKKKENKDIIKKV